MVKNRGQRPPDAPVQRGRQARGGAPPATTAGRSPGTPAGRLPDLPVGGLPDLPAGLPHDEVYRTANALHSAALRLLRRARSADVEMDLDGPRASALSVLVFAGPQPLSRLAAIEQVSPPAMSKTVTALEAAGLVSRQRSTADARVVLVASTRAGRALLERGRAARVRVIARLLADLPERDRRTLRRAAELIASRLPESTVDESGEPGSPPLRTIRYPSDEPGLGPARQTR